MPGGNPKEPDTMQLVFNLNKLDTMDQQTVDCLTEAINGVAHNWAGILSLPSTRLLHSSGFKAENITSQCAHMVKCRLVKAWGPLRNTSKRSSQECVLMSVYSVRFSP